VGNLQAKWVRVRRNKAKESTYLSNFAKIDNEVNRTSGTSIEIAPKATGGCLI